MVEETKEVCPIASLCVFVLAGRGHRKGEEMQTRCVAIRQPGNKKRREKGDYKLEKKETKIT